MDILYKCTGRDTVCTIRQVETHTDCHITMDKTRMQLDGYTHRWTHTDAHTYRQSRLAAPTKLPLAVSSPHIHIPEEATDGFIINTTLMCREEDSSQHWCLKYSKKGELNQHHTLLCWECSFSARSQNRHPICNTETR